MRPWILCILALAGCGAAEATLTDRTASLPADGGLAGAAAPGRDGGATRFRGQPAGELVRIGALAPSAAFSALERFAEEAAWTMASATRLSDPPGAVPVAFGTVRSGPSGTWYSPSPTDALVFAPEGEEPTAFVVHTADLPCLSMGAGAFLCDHTVELEVVLDGGSTLGIRSSRQGAESARAVKGPWIFEGALLSVDLQEASAESSAPGAYQASTERDGSLAIGPTSVQVAELHQFTASATGGPVAARQVDQLASTYAVEGTTVSLRGVEIVRAWVDQVERACGATGEVLEDGADVGGVASEASFVDGGTLVDVRVDVLGGQATLLQATITPSAAP